MINIENNYYIDSHISLVFFIDKDYNIKLTESEMTDGDDGDSEESNSVYNIVIRQNEDGDINFQNKNN